MIKSHFAWFSYQPVVELRWLDRAEARGTEDEQGVTHSEWQTILDHQLVEKGEQVSRQKEDEAKMIAEANEERLNKARLFSQDDSLIASNTFKGKQLKVIVKVGLAYLGDLLDTVWSRQFLIRLLPTISNLVNATKDRGT